MRRVRLWIRVMRIVCMTRIVRVIRTRGVMRGIGWQRLFVVCRIGWVVCIILLRSMLRVLRMLRML